MSDQNPNPTPETPQEFNYETWANSQPEDIRTNLSKHFETQTTGLKTALDSERNAKKELENQIRALSAKAEKGSELETQLTTVADQLKAAETKADFFQSAAGVGVKNLNLAWVAASNDKLFKANGQPDFDELKRRYPELFTQEQPRGTAGGGAGGTSTPNQAVNDGIRAFARG